MMPSPQARKIQRLADHTTTSARTPSNAGWRATVATLKDASVEFEMVWDTADADFAAIRDTFLNRSGVEFAVMDGAVNVPGSQGLRATFMVTKFTRSEPLEEAITASVTVKQTYSANSPIWLVVS